MNTELIGTLVEKWTDIKSWFVTIFPGTFQFIPQAGGWTSSPTCLVLEAHGTITTTKTVGIKLMKCWVVIDGKKHWGTILSSEYVPKGCIANIRMIFQITPLPQWSNHEYPIGIQDNFGKVRIRNLEFRLMKL